MYIHHYFLEWVKFKINSKQMALLMRDLNFSMQFMTTATAVSKALFFFSKRQGQFTQQHSITSQNT